MASPRVKLTFSDGDVKEVVLNPRVMVEAERKFGDMSAAHAMEGSLYAAWFRLGRPGKFDDWLDTIEDWDAAGTTADPTEPAASDGS